MKRLAAAVPKALLFNCYEVTQPHLVAKNITSKVLRILSNLTIDHSLYFQQLSHSTLSEQPNNSSQLPKTSPPALRQRPSWEQERPLTRLVRLFGIKTLTESEENINFMLCILNNVVNKQSALSRMR